MISQHLLLVRSEMDATGGLKMQTTFIAILMTLALSRVQDNAKTELWEVQLGTSGVDLRLAALVGPEAGRA